jgi:hypothetical protein
MDILEALPGRMPANDFPIEEPSATLAKPPVNSRLFINLAFSAKCCFRTRPSYARMFIAKEYSLQFNTSGMIAHIHHAKSHWIQIDLLPIRWRVFSWVEPGRLTPIAFMGRNWHIIAQERPPWRRQIFAA